MDKDARSIQADGTGAGAINESARGKSSRHALVFGAVAGIAVAVLNLLAFAHEWKIADFFGSLDYPVILMMDAARERFDISGGSNGDVFSLYTLLAVFCYWALIGSLFSWLFCVVRAIGIQGIFKGIARDKVCRRALLLGPFGGMMLIGGFSVLAVFNQTPLLEGWFKSFERPGIALLEAALVRFDFLDQIMPKNPAALMLCIWAALLAYWAIVGFFLALLFCFIRVVIKGDHAAETGGSGECLSEE